MSRSVRLPVNGFKIALRGNRRQIGLWTSLCSNIVAELVGDTGFDWVVLDTEHAPNEPADILAQLQAMQGGTAEAVVRPPANDAVMIKRVLDVGARTLLIPFVQDAAEAAAAVVATRYPPAGIRGVSTAPRANRYGRVAGYHGTASDDICVVVQLETRNALTQLEAIAAVEGVDALFIGPSDLAADLGHLADSAHPEVQEAIADGCRRSLAAGRPIGILAPVEADARRYFEMGFGFVAIGSDVGVLASGCAGLLSRMQAAIGSD